MGLVQSMVKSQLDSAVESLVIVASFSFVNETPENTAHGAALFLHTESLDGFVFATLETAG